MKVSDDIYNYYEKLVLDQFARNKTLALYNADFIDDLFCIVLNQLPSRYIRHEVDMSFYMPSAERAKMAKEITIAIDKGLKVLIKEHSNE